MMKITAAFLIFTLLIFVIACNQKVQRKDASQEIKKTDTTVFYPVTDFIKKQIKAVDSSAPFIYAISIRNGKKDSIHLSTRQFDSLAMIFIKFDISDTAIKKNYKESVFDDASTKSYTLTYNAEDSLMFVQSIDVLLNEDNQQVKHIFISAFENNGGSSMLKMGWEPGRNFYINHIIQTANGKETTEQNTVVWKNRK